MQEVSVLYVCTKFEADSCIRSKVIKGSQNLEIGSRDTGHAYLGVALWSTRRRGVLYVCTKFEADISVRSKVIKGSQNLQIRSLDPGHAHLGVVL